MMKIIVSMVLIGYISINAADIPKEYKIEKGSVYYRISTIDNTQEATTKVVPQMIEKKHLLFSQYGNKKIIEVESEKGSAQKHELEYIHGIVRYRVDFKNKKIERVVKPDLMAKVFMKIGSDAKKRGVSQVLGYQCDIWEVSGSLQCLYKGIPLKIESNSRGVAHITIATAIDLERTVGQDDFLLPEYPILDTHGHVMTQGVSELNILDKKITQKYMKEMASKIESISTIYDAVHKAGIKSQSRSALNSKQKKVLVQSLKPILENQNNNKKKSLASLKKCFSSAQSLSAAQKCSHGIKPNEEPLVEWNKQERQKVLIYIDELMNTKNTLNILGSERIEPFLEEKL